MCTAARGADRMVAAAHNRRLTPWTTARSSGALAHALPRSTPASGSTMALRWGSSSCGCSW